MFYDKSDVLARDVHISAGRTRPMGAECRLGRNVKISLSSTYHIGDKCKYDRYLADLWAAGEYLNKKLVDQGHAVKVRF